MPLSKRKLSEDESDEDDEQLLLDKIVPTNELLSFLNEVISLYASNELTIPDEEQQLEDTYSY